MSGTFSATTSIKSVHKDTQSDDALHDTTDTGTVQASYAYSDGNAALSVAVSKAGGQVVKSAANDAYVKQLTIAAGGNQTVDVSGSVTDAFGNTLSFTRIVSMTVLNNSPDCTLTIGAAASNPFLFGMTGTTPAIVLRPGGSIHLNAPDSTGYASTGGSADQLKFVAGSEGAGPVIVSLHLIGVRP